MRTPQKIIFGLVLIAAMVISFVPATPISAQSSGCGISQPAFCDTFTTPANTGTRSGQLDGTIWGVSRTTGNMNLGGNLLNAWSPTTLQSCGSSPTVSPPNDVVICNGQLREAVNDGHTVTDLAMYPKQPFDFAGRTGIVTFDVSNDTMGTHDAWPEFWLTSFPVPSPFSHFDSWVALPQDGFGIRFAAGAAAGNVGSCPNNNNLSQPRWTVDSAIVIRNYVMDDTSGYGTRTALTSTPLDCVVASTGPNDGLNHVELHVAQNQIDVYATDAGTTAPLRHIAVISNANLSITRGLIWIEDSHYNAAKALDCGCGPHTQHTFAWDNVGFDGPLTYHDLAFDALDNTQINSDSTVNLGKKSDPNAASSWNVLGMPANPTAQAVRVLFNFYYYNHPTTLNIGVNGHAHTAAWPYPDTGGFTWRTFQLVIPITDLVVGTNVVTLGSDQALVTANVDIVLVNVGGSPTATPTVVPPTNTPTTGPTSTPTPTPTATALPSSTPTNTPMATNTPVPTDTPTAVPTDAPTATPTATPVTESTTTCYVEAVHNGAVQQFSRPEAFCTDQ